MEKKAFDLMDHIGIEKMFKPAAGDCKSFYKLCKDINEAFQRKWEISGDHMEELLEIQKKAIMGYPEERAYLKEKIRTLLEEEGLSEGTYPMWYQGLVEGILEENWGMGPVASWFSRDYINSASAKIIGNRIYYLVGGRMVLQEQRIASQRRSQLIRSLLLLKPKERATLDFHELYLLDGTRVTIFKGDMVKAGEEIIIFRRYIIPRYTFEEQAERGTIPFAAIPLFKSMVKTGFNVAFLGAVRSSKTTFLSTWQSYEDPSLEGVLVETDPEISLHKLMPEAPIIQLLADREKLQGITKNLMRSDADYIIMGEARDGFALDTLLQISRKGTKRVKLTYHSGDPLAFPYDVAYEIVRSLGGDLNFLAERLGATFDFLFHFIQLRDKSQKRLNSIHRMYFDHGQRRIEFKKLCQYIEAKGCWEFYEIIREDLRICDNQIGSGEWEEILPLIKELSSNKEGVK